ncbi:uncharacterized protein IWZ02DRAFT_240100 [Phyllosticta citriasiana]|uniref:Uncharacterized protein n=1 Tax=Phyllosticta citriasiana TaxID=595635 RepID=A0ABR1KQ63_9PEZI
MLRVILTLWLVTFLLASHVFASPSIRPFPTSNNATLKLGLGTYFTPPPTGALEAAATGSSPTCTTKIFGGGKFGPLSRPECTFYDSYTTVTEYVDCGGCALQNIQFGHGPVVKCGKYVNLPVGTITATRCKEDRGTVAPPTGNPPKPPRVVQRPPAGGGYQGGLGWW